jgi:hypothetical protein
MDDLIDEQLRLNPTPETRNGVYNWRRRPKNWKNSARNELREEEEESETTEETGEVDELDGEDENPIQPTEEEPRTTDDELREHVRSRENQQNHASAEKRKRIDGGSRRREKIRAVEQRNVEGPENSNGLVRFDDE